MVDCWRMIGQTIQIGKVLLTLGINNGCHRYEGFTKTSRILVRQDPWGTWSACIVKKDGKGSIISVSGDYQSPEDAGKALIEASSEFHKTISEFIE